MTTTELGALRSRARTHGWTVRAHGDVYTLIDAGTGEVLHDGRGLVALEEAIAVHAQPREGHNRSVGYLRRHL